jgi:hypothetical protein
MEAQAENRHVKVKAESTPSIYANSAEINVTTWDFRFKFGEIEEVRPDSVSVAERVRVVMSPQHAKIFSRVLAENVQKYENAFGEIVLEATGDLDGKKAK